MLTIVGGYMGSGKTLFSTILADKSNAKMLVANYQIKLPAKVVKEFSLQDFIEGKYENAMVIIDEVYAYIESRTSGNMQNRLMSYILFQSRKKNIELIITAQILGSIDIRFRKLADKIVVCEGMSKEGFEYTIINVLTQQMKKITLGIEQAKQYFKCYNTNEIIAPDQLVKDSHKLMSNTDKDKLVDEVVEKLLQIYPEMIISHAMIEDYLFKENLPSELEKFIFVRLKLQKKPKKTTKKK